MTIIISFEFLKKFYSLFSRNAWSMQWLQFEVKERGTNQTTWQVQTFLSSFQFWKGSTKLQPEQHTRFSESKSETDSACWPHCCDCEASELTGKWRRLQSGYRGGKRVQRRLRNKRTRQRQEFRQWERQIWWLEFSSTISHFPSCLWTSSKTKKNYQETVKTRQVQENIDKRSPITGHGG